MGTGEFTVYVNEPAMPNAEKQEFAKLLEVIGHPGNYEEFRELWKHKWQPAMGKTIRVFRSDVSPLWEDKANANGGKLGLIVKEGDQADSMFLKIVAAMVRGELSCTDQINGVVLSLRRTGYSIAVWHRSARCMADCVELECDLRILLDVTDLSFRTHKELQEIGAGTKPHKDHKDHSEERVEPRFGVQKHSVHRQPTLQQSGRLLPKSVTDPCPISKSERRIHRRQPKYTLAQLEQQWEKEWSEQRQWEAEQKFSTREWMWGMAIFAVTATITTTMVSMVY